MASKKTLNVKNLETLGATRLAELLIEISSGNAAAKRRLRLELASTQGSNEVAREVRKRFTTIGRSRSLVDWQTRKALVDDLETQRRAIVEQVAKQDPAEAYDLMWRFMGLADSIFERCDDSSGTVIGIFHDACLDLGDLAITAKPDTETLAQQVCTAVQDNGYGQYDYIIKIMAPALGNPGLDLLKARLQELSEAPSLVSSTAMPDVIGWGRGGPISAEDFRHHQRIDTIRYTLRDIADAQGDVDGFIAQFDTKTRTAPKIAAEIAQRLLAAGRVDEAWTAIDAVEEKRSGWIPFEWEKTRLDVLEGLGRGEEAQAFRWSCFERTLSETHLRAYLGKLSDFEDVEAEERALDFALSYPSVLSALAFLVSWPALARAALLVQRRTKELDGNYYEVLTPAAEALMDKHPLEATLLLRAMIDFALSKGRSSRYRHAARHLSDCARLAASIDDFGEFEPHDVYAARLKGEHGRKSSFWSLVS